VLTVVPVSHHHTVLGGSDGGGATTADSLERSRKRVTLWDSSLIPCARTSRPYRSAARGLAMAAVSSIRPERSIVRREEKVYKKIGSEIC